MKNWIQSLLYSPKHSKATDENVLRLILPSIMGIALCMVCLAGTSWAWFSAAVQTPPQTITAASYNIFAVVTDGNGNPVEKASLEAGKSYTVVLTANGTAPSGGYCKVEGGNSDPLYTSQLSVDESLTFTLIPEETAIYTFTGVWGSYSGTPNISNGCTIGENTEPTSALSTSETQQADSEKEPDPAENPPDTSSYTEPPTSEPAEEKTESPTVSDSELESSSSEPEIPETSESSAVEQEVPVVEE